MSRLLPAAGMLVAAAALSGCAVSKDDLGFAGERDHHAASELDPRAGEHCDCNRALPGSPQSAVQVPHADR
jgi:hypothetical protein